MSFMTAEQTWQVALDQLKHQLTRATFNTWVKNAKLVQYTENTYTIGVKNAYAKDWLENRLLGTIKNTLSNTAGNSIDVEVVIVSEEKKSENELNHMESTERNGAENTHHNNHRPKRRKRPSSQLGNSIKLSPNYTFERFVVGSSNQLAHAASLAVAERPGEAYNPLFLYGGVGLGKTHLLQAIAHRAYAAGKRVIYVSSETFTNDFINAIRRQTTEDFREHYRNADFLLIDDIQFIAGKESTQEEFFHTFNDIHSAGGQIVLTSDRLPRAIPTLEDRLSSRFEWGLLTDIQPPDLETRLAILRFKADEIGARVPADVMDFIARRAQSNIRELEGALNKVVAHAALIREHITLDLAKQALQNLVNRRANITVDMVLEEVSEFYGVSVEELRSNGRSKRLSVPRHMAMYLAREETKASLPQIGEALGGRDHTTILYGCEKISKQVETNEQIRRNAMQIREHLYQKVS